MKRKCAMGSTRGSEKPGKTTKKMVYEFDDDYIPSSPPKGNMAMKSNPRTRSQAATIRKCPVSNKPEKGTNTKGATSKSPKLTCARRIVETNYWVATNRGKQPAEEFTDENAPHENQDIYPSGSSSRDPTPKTNSQLDKLLADEDAELQQPRNSASPSSTELVQNILSSTVAKEKNAAQEAHSIHLAEMAAMMDNGPLDDAELEQPKSPTIPSSSELVQNNLPSTVAMEINEAQEAHSVHLTEMAAMMDHGPSDDAELQQPRNPTIPSSTELVRNILPSTVANEKNAAQEEAHGIHLAEMAATMDHGPLDDAGLQQPRNPTIPSSTELVQSNLPSTVAKEINEAQEAHSIHLTEMAAMMDHGPSDDDDEAESSIDQTLISVGGYLVKKEIAPLLKKIIDKHKDIAKECKNQKRKSHVHFLEMICVACQKLGDMSLKDVDDRELEGMLKVLEGIQHLGFDVKWLSERLEDISKMKRLLKHHPAIKEENTKLDLQKKEIDMLKQQLSAAEAKFFAKKTEVDKVNHDFNQEIKDLKAKGLQYWDKSLLYGLI